MRGIKVVQSRFEEPLETDQYSLPAKFDVVLLADVLEHMTDPEAGLSLARNRLADGGSLLISMPNVAHLSNRLSIALGRFNYSDRGLLDKAHLRFFTKATFMQLLKENGLTIDKFLVTPAPIEEVWPAVHVDRPLWFLQDLGVKLARFRPTLFAYQFVVEVRPR